MFASGESTLHVRTRARARSVHFICGDLREIHTLVDLNTYELRSQRDALARKLSELTERVEAFGHINSELAATLSDAEANRCAIHADHDATLASVN